MSSLSPLVASEAPVGRADEIVQRITEAIHLGLLDDGERLPVEIDLAAQFGVAPMTVREALATLREQELVETAVAQRRVVRPQARGSADRPADCEAGRHERL